MDGGEKRTSWRSWKRVIWTGKCLSIKSSEVEGKLKVTRSRHWRWMTRNNPASNLWLCVCHDGGPLSVWQAKAWWEASQNGYKGAWASLRCHWVLNQFSDEKWRGCIPKCQVWDENGWRWGWKCIGYSIIICFQMGEKQICVRSDFTCAELEPELLHVAKKKRIKS